MKGPSANGALLYANAVDRLAAFYATVCDLPIIHRSEALVVLGPSHYNLVIHQSPVAMEASQDISERSTAIKLFFTVEDIEIARANCETLGGSLKAEIWQGPNFSVSNALDPEGNIFQLRWQEK